jgi:hypothetical protein
MVRWKQKPFEDAEPLSVWEWVSAILLVTLLAAALASWIYGLGR